MNRHLTLLVLFTITGLPLLSQEYQGIDRIYVDNIKTVKLHRSEWNLSYPLISLNSDETLILHFDLLGSDIETYYYTFIHCDREWNRSDIYPTDYIDGFSENQITEYEMSFNTTINYVHYSLTFPNSDVSFNYSGNYLIEVYPIGEPENPVLTKRFMISENRVSIDADPQRPKIASEQSTGQQFDFTVNYPGFRISDPYRTVFASVLQNGRWDNAKTSMKPDFIGNSQLVYNDLSGRSIFRAGSEFRYFDIKSLRYQTQYVRAIEHEAGNYHVYLMLSDNRSASQYFYHKDFNGKYYTAIQEGRDHEVEADYVFVYFTLPSSFPIIDSDIYVFGALSDWDTSDFNRMRYDPVGGRYECTMLLKQGWYNYVFMVTDKSGDPFVDQPFESDHFETENDYLVLVYLSEPMERYDRLIGSGISNTLSHKN